MEQSTGSMTQQTSEIRSLLSKLPMPGALSMEPRLQGLGKGGAKAARAGQGRSQDRHCHGRRLHPNEAGPGARLAETGDV